MIFPDINDNKEHVLVPIHKTSNDIRLRKRKRRWVYYVLCILLSFVCSRIALIFISVSKFDFKNYTLEKIEYNSRDHKKIYVEAYHRNAFSPLHAKILEGVVSLYSNNAATQKRELLAEIHIPLVNIEKYKNFQFKGDIRIKNIRPQAIYKCKLEKLDISIDFAGSVWFRFCYINFKKSHTEETTISCPFTDDKTTLKDGPVVQLTDVEYSVKEQYMCFDFKFSIRECKIPVFLDCNFKNIAFEFGGDTPCRLIVSELIIKNGEFVKSIHVQIAIAEKDVNVYADGVRKFCMGEDVACAFKNVYLNGGDQFKDFVQINIADVINSKMFSSKEKKIFTAPLVTFRDIFHGNKYFCGLLEINLNAFPLISESTQFNLSNIKQILKLGLNGSNDITLELNMCNSKEVIRCHFKCTYKNLQELAKFWQNSENKKEEISFKVNIISNMQLFFTWDYNNLVMHNNNAQHTIYVKKRSEFCKTYTFNHDIDFDNGKMLVYSSSNFVPKSDTQQSIWAYFMLPDINLNFRSKTLIINVKIPETNIQLLQDYDLLGILNVETTVLFRNNIENYGELKVIPEEQFEWVIGSKTIRIYDKSLTGDMTKQKDRGDDKKEDDKEVIDKKNLNINFKNLIDEKMLRFAVQIQSNCKTLQLADNTLNVINNCTIAKGHSMRLLFSGAEIVQDDHLLLLDDFKFRVLYNNKGIKVVIEDLLVGISLFSEQEIKIALCDKVRFGSVNNHFTNAIALYINNKLEQDEEKNFVVQNTFFKSYISGTSKGFKNDLYTRMSLLFTMDEALVGNFKFNKIDFDDFKYSYVDENTKEELCSIVVEKENGSNDLQIKITVEFTKKLIIGKEKGFFVYNNKPHCVASCSSHSNNSKRFPVSRHRFFNILKAFISPIGVNEKVEDLANKKMNNLVIDASGCKLMLKNNIEATALRLKLENSGYKQLIQYSINSLFSKIFNGLPSILMLDVDIENVDIVYLDLDNSENITFNRKSIDVHLSNIQICQHYYMSYKSQSDKNKHLLNTDNEQSSNCNITDRTIDACISTADKLNVVERMSTPGRIMHGGKDDYSLNLLFDLKAEFEDYITIQIEKFKMQSSIIDFIFSFLEDSREAARAPFVVIFNTLTLSVNLHLNFDLDVRLPEGLLYEAFWKNKRLLKKNLESFCTKNGVLYINLREFPVSVFSEVFSNLKSKNVCIRNQLTHNSYSKNIKIMSEKSVKGYFNDFSYYCFNWALDRFFGAKTYVKQMFTDEVCDITKFLAVLISV